MSGVDDLLAELNDETLPSKKDSALMAAHPALTGRSGNPPGSASSGSGVDDLLGELSVASALPDRQALPGRTAAGGSANGASSGANGAGKKGKVVKCAVVSVCPPENAVHRCPTIMCTKCDFKVVVFDGWDWGADVDYQFTRYFYPDFKRLRERMSQDDACAAYVCQCSHLGVRENKSLAAVVDAPPWVCMGH
eukprot:TRINITY_DN7631_c0_g1_i2.p1 TRINITY_DN7631_c0_g1~~TRINITY_DN7631_c0_g1_i2.p1  ORF type:complete len:193 (-),score=20.12 TRINITY_DN7631_c0_g1_i2:166-744(-)